MLNHAQTSTSASGGTLRGTPHHTYKMQHLHGLYAALLALAAAVVLLVGLMGIELYSRGHSLECRTDHSAFARK